MPITDMIADCCRHATVAAGHFYATHGRLPHRYYAIIAIIWPLYWDTDSLASIDHSAPLDETLTYI